MQEEVTMTDVERHMRVCVGCPEYFMGVACRLITQLQHGYLSVTNRKHGLFVPKQCQRLMEQIVMGQKKR